MKTEYTPEDLASMTAEEFELCREAGHEFRRNLTHAVMVMLAVPESWDMNGEYAGEYGGLFPVQIRFAPGYGRFRFALCSPGEISDHWLLLLISADGRSVTCVRDCPQFAPEMFSAALRLAATLDNEGYNLCYILAMLTGEGAV
ncbi:TPA: conjugation system SOS inhibitor PsiB [Salmonella enterica]|uniref:Conjugation system SOS inhibitor PsiB n=1 Tax=Salmonella enterica TaxID=28901 RepID=A0A758AM86_SALER|nr:conjugation system SOS inhibitor PsiB [Salmonella enterica]